MLHNGVKYVPLVFHFHQPNYLLAIYILCTYFVFISGLSLNAICSSCWDIIVIHIFIHTQTIVVILMYFINRYTYLVLYYLIITLSLFCILYACGNCEGFLYLCIPKKLVPLLLVSVFFLSIFFTYLSHFCIRFVLRPEKNKDTNNKFKEISLSGHKKKHELR